MSSSGWPGLGIHLAVDHALVVLAATAGAILHVRRVC
jgi:hypothetical protein